MENELHQSKKMDYINKFNHQIKLDNNLPPLEAYLYKPQGTCIYEIIEDTSKKSIKNNNNVKALIQKFENSKSNTIDVNTQSSTSENQNNSFINKENTHKRNSTHDELELKLINEPFKIRRKIFENPKNYFLFEKAALEEVNETIIEKKLAIPYNFTQGDKLRFLQALNYSTEETFKLILHNLDFRTNYKNLYGLKLKGKTSEILNSGALYIHGRDADYRPLVVFQLSKYLEIQKKYSLDEWLEAIVYLCNYMNTKLMIPGIVETWNVFLFLENASLFGITTELRTMISIMQSHFKGRLHLIYIFKMSSIFKFLMAVITKMYPYVESKMRIVDEENKEETLLKHVNSNQIEKKFYGECENIETMSCFKKSELKKEDKKENIDIDSNDIINSEKETEKNDNHKDSGDYINNIDTNTQEEENLENYSEQNIRERLFPLSRSIPKLLTDYIIEEKYKSNAYNNANIESIEENKEIENEIRDNSIKNTHRNINSNNNIVREYYSVEEYICLSKEGKLPYVNSNIIENEELRKELLKKPFIKENKVVKNDYLFNNKNTQIKQEIEINQVTKPYNDKDDNNDDSYNSKDLNINDENKENKEDSDSDTQSNIIIEYRVENNKSKNSNVHNNFETITIKNIDKNNDVYNYTNDNVNYALNNENDKTEDNDFYSAVGSVNTGKGVGSIDTASDYDIANTLSTISNNRGKTKATKNDIVDDNKENEVSPIPINKQNKKQVNNNNNKKKLSSIELEKELSEDDENVADFQISVFEMNENKDNNNNISINNNDNNKSEKRNLKKTHYKTNSRNQSKPVNFEISNNNREEYIKCIINDSNNSSFDNSTSNINSDKGVYNLNSKNTDNNNNHYYQYTKPTVITDIQIKTISSNNTNEVNKNIHFKTDYKIKNNTASNFKIDKNNSIDSTISINSIKNHDNNDNNNDFSLNNRMKSASVYFKTSEINNLDNRKNTHVLTDNSLNTTDRELNIKTHRSHNTIQGFNLLEKDSFDFSEKKSAFAFYSNSRLHRKVLLKLKNKQHESMSPKSHYIQPRGIINDDIALGNFFGDFQDSNSSSNGDDGNKEKANKKSNANSLKKIISNNSNIDIDISNDTSNEQSIRKSNINDNKNISNLKNSITNNKFNKLTNNDNNTNKKQDQTNHIEERVSLNSKIIGFAKQRTIDDESRLLEIKEAQTKGFNNNIDNIGYRSTINSINKDSKKQCHSNQMLTNSSYQHTKPSIYKNKDSQNTILGSFNDRIDDNITENDVTNIVVEDMNSKSKDSSEISRMIKQNKNTGNGVHTMNTDNSFGRKNNNTVNNDIAEYQEINSIQEKIDSRISNNENEEYELKYKTSDVINNISNNNNNDNRSKLRGDFENKIEAHRATPSFPDNDNDYGDKNTNEDFDYDNNSKDANNAYSNIAPFSAKNKAVVKNINMINNKANKDQAYYKKLNKPDFNKNNINNKDKDTKSVITLSNQNTRNNNEYLETNKSLDNISQNKRKVSFTISDYSFRKHTQYSHFYINENNDCNTQYYNTVQSYVSNHNHSKSKPNSSRIDLGFTKTNRNKFTITSEGEGALRVIKKERISTNHRFFLTKNEDELSKSMIEYSYTNNKNEDTCKNNKSNVSFYMNNIDNRDNKGKVNIKSNSVIFSKQQLNNNNNRALLNNQDIQTKILSSGDDNSNINTNKEERKCSDSTPDSVISGFNKEEFQNSNNNIDYNLFKENTSNNNSYITNNTNNQHNTIRSYAHNSNKINNNNNNRNYYIKRPASHISNRVINNEIDSNNNELNKQSKYYSQRSSNRNNQTNININISISNINNNNLSKNTQTNKDIQTVNNQIFDCLNNLGNIKLEKEPMNPHFSNNYNHTNESNNEEIDINEINNLNNHNLVDEERTVRVKGGFNYADSLKTSKNNDNNNNNSSHIETKEDAFNSKSTFFLNNNSISENDKRVSRKDKTNVTKIGDIIVTGNVEKGGCCGGDRLSNCIIF